MNYTINQWLDEMIYDRKECMYNKNADQLSALNTHFSFTISKTTYKCLQISIKQSFLFIGVSCSANCHTVSKLKKTVEELTEKVRSLATAIKVITKTYKIFILLTQLDK